MLARIIIFWSIFHEIFFENNVFYMIFMSVHFLSGFWGCFVWSKIFHFQVDIILAPCHKPTRPDPNPPPPFRPSLIWRSSSKTRTPPRQTGIEGQTVRLLGMAYRLSVSEPDCKAVSAPPSLSQDQGPRAHPADRTAGQEGASQPRTGHCGPPSKARATQEQSGFFFVLHFCVLFFSCIFQLHANFSWICGSSRIGRCKNLSSICNTNGRTIAHVQGSLWVITCNWILIRIFFKKGENIFIESNRTAQYSTSLLSAQSTGGKKKQPVVL